MNMSSLEEEPIYFQKEWSEINTSIEVDNKTYYINAYPLDIYECDTICIRVYSDEEMTDMNEYGNGLWIFSDQSTFDGNDELDLDENTEVLVIDKVFEILKEQGVV